MKRFLAIFLIFSILGQNVPLRADPPPQEAAEALQKLQEFQNLVSLVTNLGAWSVFTIGGFSAVFSAWKVINHTVFSIVPKNTYGRLQERSAYRLANRVQEISEREPIHRNRLNKLGVEYQTKVAELQQHRKNTPRGMPGYDIITNEKLHSDRVAMLLTQKMRQDIVRFGQNKEGYNWLIQFERLRKHEQGIFDAMKENVDVMMGMKQQMINEANSYVRARFVPIPDYFGMDPFVYRFEKAKYETDGVLIFSRNGDDARIDKLSTIGNRFGDELRAETLKFADKANRFWRCQSAMRILGGGKALGWGIFGAASYGVNRVGSYLIQENNNHKQPQQIVNEGKKKDEEQKLQNTSDMTTIEADAKKLKDLRKAGDTQLDKAYKTLRGQIIAHSDLIKGDVLKLKPQEAKATKFEVPLNKFTSNNNDDLEAALDNLDWAFAEAYRVTLKATVVNPEKLKTLLFSKEPEDQQNRQLLIKNTFSILLGNKLWPLLAKDPASVPITDPTRIKLATETIKALDANTVAQPIKVGDNPNPGANTSRQPVGMDKTPPAMGVGAPGNAQGLNVPPPAGPAFLAVPDNGKPFMKP